MLLTRTYRPLVRTSIRLIGARSVSTLPNNPHIYYFSNDDGTHTLSLLPTSPPTPSLAIGTTTTIPPTPDTLTTNHNFLQILNSVLSQHATKDPSIQSQAQAYASTAGGAGLIHPSPSNQSNSKRSRRAQVKTSSSDPAAGAGAANVQGGMGGAGRGGFVHVSDTRNPPDFGRIAWPEDIFGSLEVDAQGNFEGNGNYQESGTYRVVTREGILGLPDYLRGKVIERLRELEKGEKGK